MRTDPVTCLYPHTSGACRERGAGGADGSAAQRDAGAADTDAAALGREGPPGVPLAAPLMDEEVSAPLRSGNPYFANRYHSLRPQLAARC